MGGQTAAGGRQGLGPLNCRGGISIGLVISETIAVLREAIAVLREARLVVSEAIAVLSEAIAVLIKEHTGSFRGDRGSEGGVSLLERGASW